MYRGIIKNNTGLVGGVGISEGTFTMNGAEAVIEDNTGHRVGGVSNGGTFNMYAGIIQGNTTPGFGGGVSNGGTFTMYDGTIKKNMVGGNGGGVSNNGIFNMNGGTIKENTALSHGGGVSNGETFNMKGGTIGGENPGDANTAPIGNGVSTYRDFAMSGGIITGNTGINNYGVYVTGSYSDGAFVMSGSAQVTQDNVVFLDPGGYPRYAIVIDGVLSVSPAANIIHASPTTGAKLLLADSSALITENIDKFLYDGGSVHIDSAPYYDGGWYGVYK
jgi:hypothetical protein